ncbi:hypothetical protein Fot_10741 [Forsythia ovata]|uniref:Uncharacterized protein n=1 Tax=Forsythia ovata TaxID=205694 RepID=A0ABD1WHP0_9LAMI
MSGFHFSKVPKFKIRRGEISGGCLSSLRGVTHGAWFQAHSVAGAGDGRWDNPHILPSARGKSGHFRLHRILLDPCLPSGTLGHRRKGKPKVESGEQASRTSSSPAPGRCEYINIGARQDKLDPSVVEKLPPVVALAATSVHKYWTFFLWEGGRYRRSDRVDEASRNVHLPQSRFKL